MKNQQQQLAEFEERWLFERGLWHQGVRYIAGIDEVGRGALAGPLVVGAVILPRDFDVFEVNDSKQLSESLRERLAAEIREQALSYTTQIGSVELIDQVNIYEATRQTMLQAADALTAQPNHLLIDAMDVDTNMPQTKLIKGDSRSNSIAAASIIAKIERDHLMTEFSKTYPDYQFANNKGYGTVKHRQAIQDLGPTAIHRKTFEPVRSLLAAKA